jgi:putative ABC transport system permease protein
MNGFLIDLKHTLRALAARPVFTGVVVLTLGLGLGVNTAFFSVVQAVLLRPLPFSDAERIVILGEYTPSVETEFVSPVTFADWSDHNEVFEELAAHRHWQNVNFEDGLSEPEPIDLVTPSANFFEVMGIEPALGRTFVEEQTPNGGSEAVLSHEFWQRRYGGDASVLGKTVRIRGNAVTVVGVMPPVSANLALGWGDAWTCWYRYDLAQQRATSYRARYLTVVGRLRPGTSLERARERMTALQHRLWEEATSVAEGYEVRLESLPEVFLGRQRTGLAYMSGAAALTLLIACGNVAALLLARAAERRNETALRLALGGGAARLLRLALSESLLLAASGAAVGAVFAGSLVRLLPRLAPELPRVGEVAITPGTFGFASLAAIGSALLIGLAPTFEMRRTALGSALRSGGRGGTGGVAAVRTRRALVAAQVAMACLLLASTGLLLRSFERVLSVDPGFQAEQGVRFDLYLPSSRYADAGSWTRFYRELTRVLEETPGIESAGGLMYFPFKPKLWLSAVWIEGAPVPDGEEPIVYFNEIAGSYFEAMGIRLLEGRLPSEREIWEDSGVLLINEAMARQVFPEGNPLGRRIRTGKDEEPLEVIGVVEDVRQKNLEEPSRPEFYAMFSGMPMPFFSIVARTSAPPKAMLNSVRDAVRKLDPGLAVAELEPLTDYMERHTGERRFAVILLALAAGLALILAAVGVYGVIAYAVAQRQREIGVRMALGATPASIRKMILSEGFHLAGVGLVFGLLAAVAAGWSIRAFLFGVSGLDPATYVAVAGVVAAVAAAACWWPARTASRVDAVSVVRGD